MRVFKWMFIMAVVAALAACGEDRGTEETAEDVQEKAESAYEETKEGTEEALEETKEDADEMTEEEEDGAWEKTKEGADEAWEDTKEGSREAWEATKEGSRKAWAATKEYSKDAWNKTRESFKGDMTADDKQAFDDCTDKLQQDEDLTEEQAERGCWRMMEEETLNDYLAEGESSESGE